MSSGEVKEQGATKGGSSTEVDAEEPEMEELTRIMSEDIETQIHKLEAQNSDCQDLKMWYLDCIGTIRNVLDSIDELQEISASLQEEGEVHEALSKDVSVTSVDSVADDMWYVAFGADYNSASLDQDIYMDYDLIANEILDKKRIEGVTMYKVEWKGGPGEDPIVSWHPYEELECRNLILKFEAKRQPEWAAKQGIYFTSNLEKASHFGDTILVCEVLTGKEKVVHEADYELNGLKLRASGHDSVYAPAGCGGNVFDEVLDREEGPAAGRDMNSIGAPCPVHINGEGR